MPNKNLRLRRAAIVAKPHIEEMPAVVSSLVGWLRQHDIEPLVEEKVWERVSGKLKHRTFLLAKPPRDADLLIVLGGDGTLLSAARAMGSKQVPILGVNLGSLGFLTDVAVRNLNEALDCVLAGDYTLDERIMLDTELERRGEILTHETILNDVVVTKGAIARIIEVGVSINDQFVANVRADGLIVSTPTGSTAYSLAAGGPILVPGIGSLIITPICPHTLTYRPVVVSDRSRIQLALRSETEEVYATFDGQASARMQVGDTVCVKKSRQKVKLISLPNKNYFRILRHKLRWAERPRSRRQGTAPEIQLTGSKNRS